MRHFIAALGITALACGGGEQAGACDASRSRRAGLGVGALMDTLTVQSR